RPARRRRSRAGPRWAWTRSCRTRTPAPARARAGAGPGWRPARACRCRRSTPRRPRDGAPPPPSSSRRPTMSPAGLAVQPGVAGGVLPRVVGVEIDEHALDQEVADLEHVAPAARAPVGDARAPGAVLVLAVAGALAHQHVRAGEDPVELGVMVLDPLESGPDVAEQLADLLLARGDAPLGEVHLGVVGEQIEDAAAVRGLAAPVERLQVLDRHALALLVGHGLGRYGHGFPSLYAVVGTRPATLSCIHCRNVSRSRLIASHAA